MTAPRDTLQLLTRVPLLASLSTSELGELIRQGSLRNYPAHTLIMRKGDLPNGLYVILAGHVKVFSADDHGKEIVLNELRSGDYLGELALIGDSTRSASVITLEPSRLLLIPKSCFTTFLMSRPDVAMHILTMLAGQVRKLTEEVERLALRDVYARLAETLTARAVEEDDRLVTDALTQRDLAALVGSSREMISRILKDLKTGGYISLDGKRVVIHRKLPERR